MFVVVRRYAAGARASEVAWRFGEGLVPILTKLPGFRAYYALALQLLFEVRPAALVPSWEQARLRWAAHPSS